MNNIFKDAKFGDKFMTVSGKEAVLVSNWSTEWSSNNESFIRCAVYDHRSTGFSYDIYKYYYDGVCIDDRDYDIKVDNIDQSSPVKESILSRILSRIK